MNIRRQDMVGIGCAFSGAALGAFVAAPMFGGTPAVFTAIGVGLGWSISKVIIGHLEASELKKAQEAAKNDAPQNDEAFAQALFGSDKRDQE